MRDNSKLNRVSVMIDEVLQPQYVAKLKEELQMTDGEDYVQKYTNALKTLTMAYRVLEEMDDANKSASGDGIILNVLPGQENLLDELEDNVELQE